MIRKKSAMIVKKIFELVKENKAITREELASQVFLSPDYMAKVFKKETGKRISDYLSEVRLQEAKCLLTDTTRSISDIASSLSYSNFSGFSRMFKSETGLSPAEYRKKAPQSTLIFLYIIPFIIFSGRLLPACQAVHIKAWRSRRGSRSTSAPSPV